MVELDLKRLLVKSSLRKEDFQKAYSLLDYPPLDFDCGKLCGKLCCQEYEPGVGMYLLPGEECMFTGTEPWLKWQYQPAEDYDFPPEWNGMVAFVTCQGTCPREKRPIQCRTFPLMPYMDPQGTLTVRIDQLSGAFICPLVRYPEKYPLKPEFYKRVLAAWQILTRDPLIRADVAWQSRKLDQDIKASWRKLV